MSNNRFIPNSFQTPNVLVDGIMPLLTPTEWLVLSFATRHILGWQDRVADRRASISLSRFELCGLSRSAILKALLGLEQFRLLRKIGLPNARGQLWELNFDQEVDIRGLKARQFDRVDNGRRRTKSARSVAQTGQSDIPKGGLSNRPIGGLSDRHNKDQCQTQDQTQKSSAIVIADGLPGSSEKSTPSIPKEQSPAAAKAEARRGIERNTPVTAAESPTSPGSGPPPPSLTAPAKQPHVALIDAYLNALPAKPIERSNPYSRYGSIATKLVAAGITPAQVTDYVRSQSQEKIWLGKCIPLEYVARHINAWLELNRKGVMRHEPEQSAESSEQAGQTGNNLVRADSAAGRTSPPKPRPIITNTRGKI